MMFFSLALYCASTLVVNLTKVWTNEDMSALQKAHQRCGELYKNSPCVKKFVKVKSNVYRVICTQEKR